MHSRKREFEKMQEEIEDQLYRAQDESDNLRRTNETLDRENFDLKK